MNLPTVQERRIQSLGGDDPLEREMATLSSILAWSISKTEEHFGLQFTGSQRLRRDRVTLTFTYISLLHGIKIWHVGIYLQSKNRRTEVENRPVVAKWEGEEEEKDWEVCSCKAKVEERFLAQSCQTLSDAMEHSPPISSVHMVAWDSPGKNPGMGPFPSIEDLTNTGIKPESPESQADPYRLRSLRLVDANCYIQEG